MLNVSEDIQFQIECLSTELVEMLLRLRVSRLRLRSWMQRLSPWLRLMVLPLPR